MKKIRSAALRRFSHHVRRRRLELGISQEALAEKVGLNPFYVSRLERQLMNISIVSMERIARALECELVELLGAE